MIDVDGSCFQRYCIPQGIIKVSNDFEVYALYVDSDVDLTNVLKSIYDKKTDARPDIPRREVE